MHHDFMEFLRMHMPQVIELPFVEEEMVWESSDMEEVFAIEQLCMKFFVHGLSPGHENLECDQYQWPGSVGYPRPSRPASYWPRDREQYGQTF